jgi:hypothetical protein
MLAKKHKTRDGKLILAICDDDLLGKRFADKDFQIDLTGDFYKGKKESEEEIKKTLDKVYIINAVGEKCIEFLLKLNLVDKKNIIRISGVPHAEVMIVREE